MVSVDLDLARQLRDELALERAVETGTYLGTTTRALAGVFPPVVTIERSPELHSDAVESLGDLPGVEALQGHSADQLPAVSDPGTPTLYFLDGHWSSGVTAGEDDECPLLRELQGIGAGNPGACLIVDDARLFTAPPPPPHDPHAWPTQLEVFDTIRADRLDHHVTVLGDQILAVPRRAKSIVDAYGQRIEQSEPQPRGVVATARSLLRR